MDALNTKNIWPPVAKPQLTRFVVFRFSTKNLLEITSYSSNHIHKNTNLIFVFVFHQFLWPNYNYSTNQVIDNHYSTKICSQKSFNHQPQQKERHKKKMGFNNIIQPVQNKRRRSKTSNNNLHSDNNAFV